LIEVENVLENKTSESVCKFNEILKPIVSKFTALYPNINSIYLRKDLSLAILDRDEKNVDLLSAGQKQVLNFLIIKALIQYGGFSDFVVVDTPLGRLSKANRKLIMNECYTSFNQMTLLITDSEADGILELSKNSKSLKQAYPKSYEYTISLSLMGSIITAGGKE
jgi:DNA sulfur modification protein DndD